MRKVLAMRERRAIDGAERVARFEDLPQGLREGLQRLGRVRSDELGDHRNAFVAYRQEGVLVAACVARTVDREALALLALALPDRCEREEVLSCLIRQAFSDERGFCSTLRYAAMPTREFADWRLLSTMANGRVYANPGSADPPIVATLRARLREVFRLDASQTRRQVPPSQVMHEPIDRRLAPWWEAQIEGGYCPVLACALA